MSIRGKVNEAKREVWPALELWYAEMSAVKAQGARPMTRAEFMLFDAYHALAEVRRQRASRPYKYSSQQLQMLRSAAVFGDPWHHVRGQAEHGGAHGTVVSLVKRKLLTEKYEITALGRAVLNLNRK